MFCARSFAVAAVLLAIAALSGCGSSVESTTSGDQAGVEQPAKAGHAHAGWWCDEHGVPEEVCALCDSKLVAKFKANDDWCRTHERPDSQCFICHPQHQAEFAAQYEAKYGKQPPKPAS